MTDQTAFEREVDEDVRNARLESIWRSYGPAIIGGVVGAIALSAGWLGYQSWQAGRQAAASDNYRIAEEVLTAEGATPEALAAFRELDDGPDGYALLARFRQAALLEDTANVSAAVGLYDEIAADNGVGRIYRGLAALKAAYLVADDSDPDALRDRLAPQLRDDNPWAAFARELDALAQMRAGAFDAARESYQLVSDDESAPQGLRSRASQMVEFLSGTIAVAQTDDSGAAAADEAAPAAEPGQAEGSE